MRGFNPLPIAHFWFFTKPGNAMAGSSCFGHCKKLLQGAKFWLWIEHISLLKHKVIKWPKQFDDPRSEVSTMTVDKIDPKQNGTMTQHATLPVDVKN